MRNEFNFRERVDRGLSALHWDAHDREGVLRAIDKEEGPVRNKLYTTVLIAAIIACIGVSALAVAGLIFSPRADAARMADAALLEKYGVTDEMHSFFERTEETGEDGETIVIYRGEGPFEYVLGTYTATVLDGEVEVRWSRDGEDTSDGFDSDAWGAEQLSIMVEDSKASRRGDTYAPRAAQIALKHGAESFSRGSLDPDSLEQNTLDASELERLIALAKDAVREVYGLTDAQIERLSYVEDLSGFLPAGDKPRTVYNVDLQLWQDQNADEQGFTAFTEKDGVYDVAIDVQNDVIESVSYDSALSGNG